MPFDNKTAAESGGAGGRSGGLRGVVTAKYGPLPVWGWAVVGVGAYLVWQWWQNRQAAPAADTQTGADMGGATANPGYGADAGNYPYPIQTQPAPPVKQGPSGFRTGPGGRIWDPVRREWVKWVPGKGWVHSALPPRRAQPFRAAPKAA